MSAAGRDDIGAGSLTVLDLMHGPQLPLLLEYVSRPTVPEPELRRSTSGSIFEPHSLGHFPSPQTRIFNGRQYSEKSSNNALHSSIFQFNFSSWLRQLFLQLSLGTTSPVHQIQHSTNILQCLPTPSVQREYPAEETISGVSCELVSLDLGRLHR
jgi:hypothetical protein